MYTNVYMNRSTIIHVDYQEDSLKHVDIKEKLRYSEIIKRGCSCLKIYIKVEKLCLQKLTRKKTLQT